MRPQSFIDHRTIEINNRIAGWWFTRNRTAAKIVIETIGRGMALTMRVLLRKKIGTETFSFWMAAVGFLLIRLFTSISAATATEVEPWDNCFNLLAFHTIETSVLNIFSLLFLLACTWYVIRTEFYHPSSDTEPPDVLERGETNLLKKLVDDDRSIFTTESFVQSMIAPVLFMGTGICLWYFTPARASAVYLALGSFFLMVDEALYHRAVIRQFRLMMSSEERLKKMRDKYERRRQNARSKN